MIPFPSGAERGRVRVRIMRYIYCMFLYLAIYITHNMSYVLSYVILTATLPKNWHEYSPSFID